MAIKFKCACGKALSARAIYAGRKVRCPECGKKVTIPEPEEMQPEGIKEAALRPQSRLEAQLLVGEDEKILLSLKPGTGVLIQRLFLFNILYALFVIAPLIVLLLPSSLDKFNLYLPGGRTAHVGIIASGLILGIVLNALIWLAWHRSIYVLTPSCVVARAGVFFATVQRVLLAKLTLVKELRFGRGLVFYGS